MKSLTKKALMLALAIAVVCSFAVFAASDITGTSATLGENGVSVTVAYTAPATASQVTILVFKTANGGESTDTVNAAPVINADGTTNIVYIDQKANAQSLDFSLRSTDGDGTYKVLIGGTGVAEAATAEFTKTSVVEPTGYTISGSIDSIVNLGNPADYADDPDTAAYIEEYNARYAATFVVYDLNSGEEIKTFTIDEQQVNPEDAIGIATFAVEGLEAGEYYIEISRPGRISRGITIIVSDNIDIGLLEMAKGDVNGDTDLNANDTAYLLTYINSAEKSETDGIYWNADYDESESVDANDLPALFNDLKTSTFDMDAYNGVYGEQ